MPSRGTTKRGIRIPDALWSRTQTQAAAEWLDDEDLNDDEMGDGK